MARSGMANVIADLRGMTETSISDYSIVTGEGTVTYWTDNQLQDRLDRQRTDYNRLLLNKEPRYVDGGSVIYQDYYFPAGYWEEASGGTAVWEVQDSTGAAIGTASYSVNYRAGHIRFTQNTSGSAYYLIARQYDLNRAAADVWRRKAAHVASNVDWSSDNHSFKDSQESARYLKMAQYYETQAGTRIVSVEREDVW